MIGCFLFFVFLFFCFTAGQVGSLFLEEGLNPKEQWKYGLPTTGPPGKCQCDRDLHAATAPLKKSLHPSLTLFKKNFNCREFQNRQQWRGHVVKPHVPASTVHMASLAPSCHGFNYFSSQAEGGKVLTPRLWSYLETGFLQILKFRKDHLMGPNWTWLVLL